MIPELIEIPKSWTRCQIGDAYRVTKKPKDVSLSEQDTILFVPMEMIPLGGSVQLEWEERTPEEVASGTYFERGDILLAKITPSFQNGKQGLADSLPGDFGVASTEVIPLQEIKGKSNRRVLFYYLLHPEVRNSIAGKMEGSTGRQRVPVSVIRDWEIFLPPLPEQRKIAAVLGKVREAVEVEEALARNARDLKKSLMRQLFTHGLHGEPTKETEIGIVPESWEVRKIGDFAKLSSGGTPARGVKEYWEGGTIPWVKTGEVDYRIILDTDEKITPEGLESSAARIFPAGTLLIAMYGQGITRGKVAVLGIDAATNQACAAILTNKSVDTRYLYYWLEQSYGELRQRSHGAQQKNLNAQLVAGFEVAHPKHIEDQREIARILRVVDDKIAVHEAKRDAYRDLFKTLLHQLMTAEIRVHDLAIDTKEAEP
jgi:type I restriction enzyme S subunit